MELAVQWSGALDPDLRFVIVSWSASVVLIDSLEE